MANEEIQTAIQTAATEGIKRARGDEGEVEMKPIEELIAADEHLKNKTAGTRRTLPIRLAKIRPGGAI